MARCLLLLALSLLLFGCRLPTVTNSSSASPSVAAASPTPMAAPSPTTAAAGPPPTVAASPTVPATTPATTVTGEVTVFAAASLTDAFKEIGSRFEAAHPGSKVTFNFGASSQLRTQLEQGARADVFASADQAQMDRAKEADRIAGPDRVFARNRLVIIVPRDNPGGVSDLRDLAKPGLRLVTAAPAVPIGVYTQQMLERLSQDPAYGADFKDRVEANVVSREPNVRQVVAKVSLGEADAAVVYSSDVTPDVAEKLVRIEMPDAFDTLATYPIAVVSDSPNPSGAQAFVELVLSPEGQDVLERWGFIPAADAQEARE